MSNLEDLIALDEATPKGPWRWRMWAGEICLIQDRSSFETIFNGWRELMSFTRKGAPFHMAGQPVFYDPSKLDRHGDHTHTKLPALSGGIWREPGGYHLGPHMMAPVARWFEEGREAYTEAVELAVRLRAERDEARALAIDLYLDANGVGPGRDWGAEEVPSWLSGEGGEVEA